MDTTSAASAASGHTERDIVNAEREINRTTAAANAGKTAFQNPYLIGQRNQNIPPTGTQDQTSPTSAGITASSSSKEDQPMHSIGDALESEVFKKLIASTKPLPVALQRQVLD